LQSERNTDGTGQKPGRRGNGTDKASTNNASGTAQAAET